MTLKFIAKTLILVTALVVSYRIIVDPAIIKTVVLVIWCKYCYDIMESI